MKTLFNRRNFAEEEAEYEQIQQNSQAVSTNLEAEQRIAENHTDNELASDENLRHKELPAEVYTETAKRVPEIHNWFDEVQAETVQRHLRSQHKESDSLSIMKKLGELHQVSGRKEYLDLAQERFETTLYREGDTLELVPYWVETAVAIEDKNALDTLLHRVVERDIDVTEIHAAEYKLTAEPLRKKLVDYAYIVNGYARLGHFEGMGAHFNRLDRYWCGDLSENYFDWMGDQSQATDIVKQRAEAHPARQLNQPDYGTQRVDILTELKSLKQSFEGQNRLYFQLLNESRIMWLNHLIEEYDVDPRLSDEPQSLQHDDTLQKEIYAQICRVTDFEAQRRLHQRHYWRQPPQGKKHYESTLSSGVIFSGDEARRSWQPSLLNGRREELVRFGLSGKDSINMPYYTRRCVEQFEDDPCIGPLKQLTLYALNHGDKVAQGGREMLEVSERFLPELRALEPSDHSEIVNMLDGLAAAAAEQQSYGYEVRFMLEKAILTGSSQHYDEFLEKRSEYIFQLNQDQTVSDAIAARHIQWKLDWGTLAEATAEYFTQNLNPQRQITIGLELLRSAINRGVTEREAGRIVKQINVARMILKAESKSIEQNNEIQPLVDLLELYKRATSPGHIQGN